MRMGLPLAIRTSFFSKGPTKLGYSGPHLRALFFIGPLGFFFLPFGFFIFLFLISSFNIGFLSFNN
jgi:hypothetical protein